MVDSVDAAPAHTDHASIGHSDIERASVRAKNAGRLDPAINVGLGGAFGQHLVHALGPRASARERCSLAPNVRDSIRHASWLPPLALLQTSSRGLATFHLCKPLPMANPFGPRQRGMWAFAAAGGRLSRTYAPLLLVVEGLEDGLSVLVLGCPDRARAATAGSWRSEVEIVVTLQE